METDWRGEDRKRNYPGKKDHRAVRDHNRPGTHDVYTLRGPEGSRMLKFAGLLGELVYSWLEWMKDWRKI